MPLQYPAVHRDLFPGAHQDAIPYPDLLHRDVPFRSLPDHPGGLGGQSHELADGLGGLPLGPGLQETAQQDQGDDHGGAVEIDVSGQTPAGKNFREKGDHRRVAKGGQGAHGDQGVHVGAAVLQALPGSCEELPPGPELHRDSQQKDDDEERAVRNLPKKGEEMRHGKDHNQSPGHHAEQEFFLQQLQFPLPLFPLPIPQFGPVDPPELIPGLLDGFPEFGQVDPLGVIGYPGLFGGEIDRRLLHPLQSGQGFFHPDHAGGTAHTAYRQGCFFQTFSNFGNFRHVFPFGRLCLIIV